MNKVFLIGRLTKDIELRKSASGMSYARFSLAVNRRRSNNNEQASADFINCVVWDKRAETMEQYLGKGSQIAIEGRIQTGRYEKDGQSVFTTDVVVDNFEFLESRSQRQTTNRVNEFMSNDFDTSGFDNTSFDDNSDEMLLDIASDDLPF